MEEKKWIETLKIVKQILDDADIRYWIDHGTLLGAVRDGKLILWDQDIDLSTTCSEVRKILNTIPKFIEKGFHVHATDFQIRMRYYYNNRDYFYLELFVLQHYGDVFYQIEDRALGIKNKYRNLIQSYTKHLANGLLYKDVSNIKGFKPSFVEQMKRKLSWRIFERTGGKYVVFTTPESHFKNLDSIYFYGMNFNIPSNVNDYLSLRYGDWKIPHKNWSVETAGDTNPKFNMYKREEYSFLKCL